MKKRSVFRRLLPWMIAIAALAALVIFVFVPIYSEHGLTAGRETRVLHYDGDDQPITIENDALLFEMDRRIRSPAASTRNCSLPRSR